jgi:hypothetical protein
MQNRNVIITAAGCAVVILIVTLTRWLGAGDLYEKDQPKTIAYTADVVLHGQWALPRDVIYQPATKPPAYSWIGAAAVWLTGSWSEWVLKFPSVLGTFMTAIIVFAVSVRLSGLSVFKYRREIVGLCENAGSDPMTVVEKVSLSQRHADAVILGCLAVAVWFTFGSDIQHGSVLRLSYLARPDMLQSGFLSIAWFSAWIAIDKSTRKKSFIPAISFWCAVTLATLTKGPAAVMAMSFAVVYALSQPCRLQRLSKLWFEIGIPLFVLGAGGWLYAAWQQNPDHVRQTILGAEVLDRVINETPEGLAKPVYYSVMWFVTKLIPWGGMALLTCVWIAVHWYRYNVLEISDTSTGLKKTSINDSRPWINTQALIPVAMYLLIVLILLSISAGKRMDYLLPGFAPASVLVAWLMLSVVRHLKLPTWLPVLLPLCLSIGLSYVFTTRFHESVYRCTDQAATFMHEVRGRVGANDRLLVMVRGKHPLLTLLGLHQGSYLSPHSFIGPLFVVMPIQDDLTPLIVSTPLPEDFNTRPDHSASLLGLYYFAAGDVPVDRLISLQKHIGTWSHADNPYRAPKTVYRDD